MTWIRNEEYAARHEDNVLAQRLHDEGLIYAVNRLVLHPLGIALGVTGLLIPGTMRLQEVNALILEEADDEVVYPDDVHERGIAKLRLAGYDELADRIEAM